MKPGENHRHIRFFGSLNGFGKQGFIRAAVLLITLREGDRQALSLGRVQRADDLEGVDIGRAAALETGFGGKEADKSDLRVFLQRQKSVIFQQHHRLRGRLAGGVMPRRQIENRLLPVTFYRLEHQL